jgi:hypothetical protein
VPSVNVGRNNNIIEARKQKSIERQSEGKKGKLYDIDRYLVANLKSKSAYCLLYIPKRGWK